MGAVEISEAPTVEPVTRPARVQRDIWHASHLGSGSGYRLAFGLTLTGDLDLRALRAAATDVVERHPLLTARFADDVAGLAVHAAPAEEADWWEVRDGTGLENPAALLAAEPARPLDLAGGPLFRLRVARAAPGTWFVAATAHHLVLDGTAKDLVVADLLEAYAARAAGRAPDWAPVPPYADYVAQELRAADDALAEFELNPPPGPGWTEVAGWSVDPGRLDDDGRSPDALRSAGHPVELRFEDDLADALRAAADAYAVSVHTVLMASFVALLDRYAPGDVPPAVAVPLGTRPEALTGTVGPFVNELPFRLPPAGDDTFRTLVGRTAEALSTLFALRAVPLGELRRRAGIRAATRPPTLVLGYRRRAADLPAEVAGLLVTYAPVLPAGDPRADLEIQLVDTGAEITGWVTYDHTRYGPEYVARLTAHWRSLAGRLLTEPDQPLAEIDALPVAEAAALDAMAHGPEPTYEGAPTLTGLIAEQTRRTPHAVALRAAGVPTSYAELDREADALAARLLAAGAGPDSPVAVLLPRSADLVVALLAALRTGAGCLPLDPDTPPQRLEFLLADSATDLLVTDDRGRERLTGFAGQVVGLDGDPSTGSGHREPGSGHRADDLAYVLYTSGSTGVPKAVAVPHRAIRNRLLWAQETYPLAPEERVLHKTSIGFDVAMWEVFWPLVCGATVVLATPGGHRDTGYLVDLIRTERVTTAHFVPSMLRAFLEEPQVHESDPLVRVLCSGEELPPDLVRRFHDRLPGVELHNLYGPTEAAIDVTATPCPPGTRRVTIGRPIANAQVLVLDAYGRPAPLGVVGELHLGGSPLALGYRGRPDLTEQRFVAGRDGRRLYRTGDLGRFLPDGTIAYAGRVDRQVKIRGQRVEPGEIEATMLDCPGIREAAVEVDGRLLGWYVADPITGPDAQGLLRWLRERLPGAMVPSALVALDALPLTGSGKLDRNALPRPEPAPPDAAPGTGTERLVADLWAELLGAERVGPHDDFFALGGDSLLVTRTLARVRDACGVDLPFRAVFDHPTVAGLAASVDAARQRQPLVDAGA